MVRLMPPLTICSSGSHILRPDRSGTLGNMIELRPMACHLDHCCVITSDTLWGRCSPGGSLPLPALVVNCNHNRAGGRRTTLGEMKWHLTPQPLQRSPLSRYLRSSLSRLSSGRSSLRSEERRVGKECRYLGAP